MGENDRIITLRLDDRQLQKVIGSLRFWQAEKKKKIAAQVRKSAFQIQRDAVTNCPVASNRLRSSIRVLMRSDGMGASVGTNLKYAQYVEFGRGSGKRPPIDVIEKWVRIKISRDPKKTKSIAFLIARKIGQEGVRKQPFLFPAGERERPRFRQAVIDIMRQRERSNG